MCCFVKNNVAPVSHTCSVLAVQRICKMWDFANSRKLQILQQGQSLWFLFFSSCKMQTESNPLSATDTLQCNKPVVDACKECIMFYPCTITWVLNGPVSRDFVPFQQPLSALFYTAAYQCIRPSSRSYVFLVMRVIPSDSAQKHNSKLFLVTLKRRKRKKI